MPGPAGPAGTTPSRRASLVALAALALCVPAGAGAATLPGFRSPSGAIRCLLLPSHELLCSVAGASYAAALRAHCGRAGLDWHGFTLGAGRKGLVNCSGGILYDPATQHPSTALLRYGRSWSRGGFTCASRTSGVTCTNRGGHGLVLSRGSWRAS